MENKYLKTTVNNLTTIENDMQSKMFQHRMMLKQYINYCYFPESLFYNRFKASSVRTLAEAIEINIEIIKIKHCE